MGNPGARYRNTRHNLGRSLVDLLSRDAASPWRQERWFEWAEGAPALVKLNSFMNESGLAVRELSRRFQAPPEDLLVCCDDFDLPLGAIRIRKKGSAGSHNGLKSVIEQLGSDGFPRLRLGIGPMPPGEDPARFVLAPFKEESEAVERMLDRASEAARCAAADGIEAAMNRFNATG